MHDRSSAADCSVTKEYLGQDTLMKLIQQVNMPFVRDFWVDTWDIKKTPHDHASSTTTCRLSSCFFRFPPAVAVKGDLVLIKIRFHAAHITGREKDFPEAIRTQSVGMSARWWGRGGLGVVKGRGRKEGVF